MDESSAPEPAFGALPARLAHLKGPVAMTTMTPPRIPDERDPHPIPSGGAVAPGTPSSAGSPPRALPGKPSTVRGSAGNLLVGPWNGPFAPAHAPPGRVVAPEAGGAKKAMEGSSSRVVASSFSFGHQCSREEDSGLSDSDEFPPPPPPPPPAPPPPRASGTARSPITDHREDLADLAFTGPDEMDLDRDAVAREQMLEDAITGRAAVDHPPTTASTRAAANVTTFPSSRRGIDPRDAASSRASRASPRAPPGRRTCSAPAASTRRPPRAGPSARRRAPAASKRAAKASLAAATREAAARSGQGAGGGRGGAGNGDGFFGAVKTARNRGARNTMGVRVGRPAARGGAQ